MFFFFVEISTTAVKPWHSSDFDSLIFLNFHLFFFEMMFVCFFFNWGDLIWSSILLCHLFFFEMMLLFSYFLNWGCLLTLYFDFSSFLFWNDVCFVFFLNWGSHWTLYFDFWYFHLYYFISESRHKLLNDWILFDVQKVSYLILKDREALVFYQNEYFFKNFII